MTSAKVITKTLSRVTCGPVRQQKSLDTHAKRDRRHHEAILDSRQRARDSLALLVQEPSAGYGVAGPLGLGEGCRVIRA